MGPAWAQAHLTGDLWLLLLCLLLPQVCSSHAPPGWRFTSSEVVIPRKVTHRLRGAGTPGQLAYKFHFRGQRHVVHMKVKKNLLPRHFPVITSNDQGASQEDYPFIPRDCYYYSYLEEVPGSMGTLDTCYGGLRGMLQVDDFTYEIRPLEASSKFEHVISLLVTEETAAVEKCKIGEEGTNPVYEEATFTETPRAGPVYFWWPHKKYLKIHYTVSNSFYRIMPNTTQIIQYVVVMNSIMHSIYKISKLDIHIRVLFIWNKVDLEYLGDEYTPPIHILETFGLWKYLNIWRSIEHDLSLLLTGQKIGKAYYFSFQGGVCQANWGVAFLYVRQLQVILSSSMAAHVIGHSLGLPHDEPGCTCFRRIACLMAPVPNILDMMSNCSYNNIYNRIHLWDSCLSTKNIPYDNFPYEASRCGDTVINSGEECDCGTFKDCLQNPCCATNCSFTLGSLCSRGDCCVRCQYAPPGLTCRDKLGICDLPEYCDGKTHDCPNDFYIQDGTPCSPLAVCVQGNCSDREMQCQALFGYKVRDAAPACYEKLNVIGDRFGNCGVRALRGGGKPVACHVDNVFCGMLHCRDVRLVPGGGEHTTFHHIIVQGVKEEACFGYDAHWGAEVPEMGLVVDGATCGPGKYCVKQKCTYHEDIGFDCDVSTCNFRGVCNNKKNCHCVQGWNPPSCNETGEGGSVDSGPPPNREKRGRVKILSNLNLMLLLVIVRLIFFLLTFCLAIYFKVETDKRKEKQTDETQILYPEEQTDETQTLSPEKQTDDTETLHPDELSENEGESLIASDTEK
ncbi:disintegrin and metalloproteinase domain-containing protein 20-like isoform X1 [Talpa occidentalis]|uniref:disintegrin and metalloproteinase domain-containing protein 20-like isoform X1 n=1 Tax=Talpa occidentalis TaxID=50954 RepID=UPI001890098D|nr:disintegrin and metalloproteinase domain-containing protein 20-like isoform X1 [Talpa occidentalis]